MGSKGYTMIRQDPSLLGWHASEVKELQKYNNLCARHTPGGVKARAPWKARVPREGMDDWAPGPVRVIYHRVD